MPRAISKPTPPTLPSGGTLEIPAALQSARALEPQPTRRRSWLRILLALLLALWLLDFGLSRLVEESRLSRYFTSHLEAAFGRPVQVGRYEFSLLEGPRLQADSITVGEDPRFGQEYFLRAESLTIGLRWQALLRGHLRLGVLSFSRPSLNVVRAADGQWDLAAWLPHPLAPGGTGRSALRFERIEVSDGRINFKQGENKLPFALIDVNGSAEAEGRGAWRLDLQAQPWRAATLVQQAGLLRVRGLAGGTSSRLRPAVLELDWQQASLSDALRLVRGYDYGVRGLFSLDLQARTEGESWAFQAQARFRQLHRWDLPLRPDDPALNLNVQANWRSKDSRLRLAEFRFEAPRSNLRGLGYLAWTHSADGSHAPVRQARLEILSSSVHLADLFEWYRAFHQGVADQVGLRGMLGVDLTLSGWPPHIERGVLATDGAELDGASLTVPVRVGETKILLSPAQIAVRPVTVTLGAQKSGVVILQARVNHGENWSSSFKASGRFAAVQNFLAAAAALGLNLPQGFEVEGPVQFDLQWSGEPRPVWTRPAGTLELGGITLRMPFLNEPLRGLKGSVRLKPDSQFLQLSSVEAFGARWNGSLKRSSASRGWQFSVAADELSLAALDRWLDPRWRQGLLERVLPFLAAEASPVAVPAGLQGSGRLSVEKLAMAPWVLRNLNGNLTLARRRIRLANARANFYGGDLRGSLDANLTANPAYEAKATFTGVNLAFLLQRSPAIANLFSGSASGNVEFSLRGLSRDALLRSFRCLGAAEVKDADFRGLDLLASMRAAARRPGASMFPSAVADFSCAAGAVRFKRLLLAGPRAVIEAAGGVDFSRNVNLRVQARPPASAANDFPGPLRIPDGVFHLTGLLNAPQVERTSGSFPPR